MPLFKKPKYSTVRTARKNIPAGLWIKCKGCNGVIYRSKLDENRQMCPDCGYHYPLTGRQRSELLLDGGALAEMDAKLESVDALDFDDGAYGSKLEAAKEKTGLTEAVLCGIGKIDGREVACAFMDFRFLGASMGSVVGEKITRLIELATERRLPLLIASASGGARMQEGVLSLMQMAKTSGALAIHRSTGLPYLALLTHPTTGGVTASFASLGDVIIAEPGALVAFAGPRVVKQTIKTELPEGFQTAEFLQQHGFIDRVVSRADLRGEIALLLEYFSGALHCDEAS